MAFPLTRGEVRKAAWLTLQRGAQTCPECPDEVDRLPDAALMLLIPKNRRRD